MVSRGWRLYRRLRRAYRKWQAERQFTRALLRMPPHLIRDIGQSVEEVDALRRQSETFLRSDIDRRLRG